MPKTYDDDDLAYPHLHGVLDALQKVLVEQRLGEVCIATPVAGEQVLWDYIGDDCDSYAWARISSTYPSMLDFPNPDPRPAPAILLASIVELGLLRRVELPDNGEVVDPAVQQEQARQAAADMKAMLVALCQYADDDLPVVIGDYRPLGPQGGVMGGSWTATFGAR